MAGVMKISALSLRLLLIGSVAVLPMAAADDDFASSSKYNKKSHIESRESGGKKKAKRKEKKNPKVNEVSEGGANDWKITDRAVWEKMVNIKLSRVEIEDVNATDFAVFLTQQLTANGLSVVAKYHPESSQTVQPFVSSLRQEGVSLPDLLRNGCAQMGCIYTVENGEIGIYSSRHLFKRTYSLKIEELCDSESEDDDMIAIMRSMGVSMTEGFDADFNEAGDELTLVATAMSHDDMCKILRQIEEWRASQPKASRIFKKYFSTMRKVSKAALRVKADGGKAAAKKFEQLEMQMQKVCSDEEAELLTYYLRVNPRELKKLKQFIEDWEQSFNSLINAIYEVDESSNAANAAENLHAEIVRFAD